MLAIFLKDSKLQERSFNLFLQLFLLIIIFTLYSDHLLGTISLGIFISHIFHYSLIALADIYEDDYPEDNRKYLVQFGLLLYFVCAVVFGLFENEFLRLHIFIVLLGNWFGGKVDTAMWKVFFLIYLGTLIGYEINSLGFLEHGISFLLYGLTAVFMIGLCERLSEKRQDAWMLHSILFFIWALYQGAYYQEGVLFILGGLAYEVTKLSAGLGLPAPQTKMASHSA
jgi:hypothetical protein